MKKITSLVLCLLAIFGIFGLFGDSQKASAETFTYEYINGVGDYGNNRQYYWISSSASSETTLINSAMENWIYGNGTGITTPISFRQTSDKSASVMDIYKGNYYPSSSGVLGETIFYVNSTSVSPNAQNWYWCEIRLNTPNFDNLSEFDEEGTIAHEMGHCMGLAHPSQTPYPISVMLQMGQGRTVNACQSYDLNDINKKY